MEEEAIELRKIFKEIYQSSKSGAAPPAKKKKKTTLKRESAAADDGAAANDTIYNASAANEYFESMSKI